LAGVDLSANPRDQNALLPLMGVAGSEHARKLLEVNGMWSGNGIPGPLQLRVLMSGLSAEQHGVANAVRDGGGAGEEFPGK
jgi:hypothetical protein